MNTTLLIIWFLQNLFAYPDGSSFWGKFAEEQKHFQEKYNALSSADLFEGLDHDGKYKTVTLYQ